MAIRCRSFAAIWNRRLHHRRPILNSPGRRVIASRLQVPRAHQAFDADGQLAGTRSRERPATLARRLLHAAAAFAAQSLPV
jgi:hypothetical protein